MFTAIGFYKPVLISPELNPEVLENYTIGQAIQLTSVGDFAQQLETFIDDLTNNTITYQHGLDLANAAYSQERLIQNLLMF